VSESLADATTNVLGIPIPSTSPLFLAVVGFHVVVGLTCVITGAVAMLSRKGRGRHSAFGVAYFWSLATVYASAAALSAVRWAENYHLFILGTLAFAATLLGRIAPRCRWSVWPRLHIAGMGTSYVLLLTAFYVDNGGHLPLWQELPLIIYWLGPAAIGLPLIAYTMICHPLVRRSKQLGG
jgi:hypothetical protein